MMVTQIADDITERIEASNPGKNEADESGSHLSPEFISIFYSAGLVYTMRWWL